VVADGPMMLTAADVHCAADHARQGWSRLSASRGAHQDLVFLMPANQPQGGIVFDSDPYDEWIETINKLGTSTTRRRFARGQHMDGLTHVRRKHAVHRVGRAEAYRRAGRSQQRSGEERGQLDSGAHFARGRIGEAARHGWRGHDWRSVSNLDRVCVKLRGQSRR
jgi:hypothetical protein